MPKSTRSVHSSAVADMRNLLQDTVAASRPRPASTPELTTDGPEAAGDGPASRRAPGTAPGALGGATRHPADGAMSRTVRKDLYSLDPRRIVEEGFYVRETDVQDADFTAFVDAVRARGEIDQPISVRTQIVSPQERRYILVWGMRRLRAALALGLPHVPVRDFGALDETAAIRLQLQENLNRKDMTPAETALAFWELHRRGVSGADIARDNARTKGYVSALLHAGQAIAALDPADRHALMAPGRFRVRDAQALMAIKGDDARLNALRALVTRSVDGPLADADPAQETADPDTAVGSVGVTQGREADGAPDAPSGDDAGAPKSPDPQPATLGRARRADEDGPFYVRPLRGGRGRVLRIRWHDHDLRDQPHAFVARFTDFLQQEVDHLHTRLAALETASPPSATQAADFQAAKDRALKLASWLREGASRAG